MGIKFANATICTSTGEKKRREMNKQKQNPSLSMAFRWEGLLGGGNEKDLVTVFDAFHHGIATVFASAHQPHYLHLSLSLSLSLRVFRARFLGFRKARREREEKEAKEKKLEPCLFVWNVKNPNGALDSPEVQRTYIYIHGRMISPNLESGSPVFTKQNLLSFKNCVFLKCLHRPLSIKKKKFM